MFVLHCLGELGNFDFHSGLILKLCRNDFSLGNGKTIEAIRQNSQMWSVERVKKVRRHVKKNCQPTYCKVFVFSFWESSQKMDNKHLIIYFFPWMLARFWLHVVFSSTPAQTSQSEADQTITPKKETSTWSATNLNPISNAQKTVIYTQSTEIHAILHPYTGENNLYEEIYLLY